MEKEIEITWNGRPEKVKIRTLLYGDEVEIRGKSRHIDEEGKLQTDFAKAELLTLQYSIVEAPFAKDMETIKKLPANIGNKISEAANELNKVTEETKKKSDLPLGSGEHPTLIPLE